MDVIKKPIEEFLISSPKLIVLLLASFFSGQLWLYIMYTYFYGSNETERFINNKSGKTALGLFWFSIPFLLIYQLKYGIKKIDIENMLSIYLETIVFGFFIQIIIFILILLTRNPRTNV